MVETYDEPCIYIDQMVLKAEKWLFFLSPTATKSRMPVFLFLPRQTGSDRFRIRFGGIRCGDPVQIRRQRCKFKSVRDHRIGSSDRFGVKTGSEPDRFRFGAWIRFGCASLDIRVFTVSFSVIYICSCLLSVIS